MADENWYDDDVATFGDRLAAAREAAGLSQRDLAQKIGVKTDTVRGWEDDMKEPRANRVQMLAGLLNVSLTWLLTGKGDGVPPPSDTEFPAEDTAGALALLAELRVVRAEVARSSDALARIEKRLRAVIGGRT